jgi:hypothetical protein
MKFSSLRYSRRALGLLTVIIAVAAFCWLGSNCLLQPGAVEAKLTQTTEGLTGGKPTFPIGHPKVQAALAAQQRHTPQILSQPDVVGTATSVDDVEEPTVVIYTKKAPVLGSLPDRVDGIPVTVKVTGEIIPMAATGVYPRPVPIGVSVGNRRECSAGTIGARVRDPLGRVFVLSNNHVLALENIAPIGSGIVQPGLYDTSCVYSSANWIGTLYDFEPISFTNDNIMDAAIAKSSKIKLGTATPADGYGLPRVATVAAAVGQKVQKYGRTTSLTKGTITAINGIFDVTYAAGTARFVNQIVVTSTSAFILPGDSGSLLVTNPSRNPVGLLFAGNAAGTLAVANPIKPVLQRFGVTITGDRTTATTSTSTGTSPNPGTASGGSGGVLGN